MRCKQSTEYFGVHELSQGRSHLRVMQMEEAHQGELLLRGRQEGWAAALSLEDATAPKEGFSR